MRAVAYELNLAEGLHMERRLFHSLFATVRRHNDINRIVLMSSWFVHRRIKRSE